MNLHVAKNHCLVPCEQVAWTLQNGFEWALPHHFERILITVTANVFCPTPDW
jgi:hypothetical protein